MTWPCPKNAEQPHHKITFLSLASVERKDETNLGKLETRCGTPPVTLTMFDNILKIRKQIRILIKH